MTALFLYSLIMLRFFLLLLSLFLVSCATTSKLEKPNVFLQLYSSTPDIQHWTQEDLENLKDGLENGDINFNFFWGTTGTNFLDERKGRLHVFFKALKSNPTPCEDYLHEPPLRWEFIPSKYCPLIEKFELSYINDLIDEANENRVKDIELIYQQERIARQRALEEDEARKIQEQQRIEQQIKAREIEFANYIAPFKKQCRAFGYSDENLVAKCVQDYVFADMAAREMAAQLQQLKQRQDQIRINKAISEMGKGLSEIGRRNPQTKICNFKAFSGAIISGDCKKSSISVGGVTYWRQ